MDTVTTTELRSEILIRRRMRLDNPSPIPQWAIATTNALVET